MEVEVKDRIVISARDFFTRFGYKKTTMDEIAKNIHKAKGVLYYYFKSKEALFHESLATELNEIKAEILQATRNKELSIDKLYEYVITRSDKLVNATLYHETIKAEINERYLFVQDVLSDFDRFERKTLHEILELGLQQKSLQLTSIDSAVDLFMLTIKSMEVPFYIKKEYAKHRNTMIELADIVLSAYKKQT